MKPVAALRAWAKRLRRDVVALWLAARDPRTPWYAKALALVVAAYALSPIDLIPDQIPVLGYLDDLVLVPLGIWCVLRLIPPDLMAEFRAAADRRTARPVSRAAAVAVVALWLAAAVLVGSWVASAGVLAVGEQTGAHPAHGQMKMGSRVSSGRVSVAA